MYLHGYRSYQKKRLKNKYGKYLMGMLAVMSLAAFFVQRQELWSIGKKAAVKMAGMAVVDVLAPGLQYEEKENGNHFLAKVEKILFPIADYTVQIKSYETDAESTLSYEMILAMEALDENYVDENGQVVMQNNGDTDNAQNTDSSQPADNAQSTDNSQAAATAQNADNPQAADGAQNADNSQAAATAQNPDTSQETSNSAEQTSLTVSPPIAATQKAVEYSLEKLNDFDYLVQNFYQVDSTTTVKSDQLNVAALTGKNMKIAHDAGTPQILIYHTHSLEGYADSIPGDKSTTVVGVGDYLTELLTQQYGYNVIHDTGEYDTIRDKAYSKAAPALEQILADNPGIDVVIDLHRDGVGENTRLVTNVNGTDMAKVMFFNGLSRTTKLGDIAYLYNPYIADNLAFSFQMQLTAAEYYPGYTRKIYLKGYRFNMHYCPKTLLVEVGAQTNTVQEAKNAMVPLADILNKVLSE